MADTLTTAQRRRAMQAVKSRNTSLEKAVETELRRWRISFRRHFPIPGTPDFAIPKQKIAIFVDGDFWHGWRFPAWKHKLSDYWQQKISRNRHRDKLNFQRLRRAGWKVIRIWGHEVNRDVAAAVEKIRRTIDEA